jgi:hypothetical protein
MIINGNEIEILAINIQSQLVDWKRTEGYTGACVTKFVYNGFETLEADIEIAIEQELDE